MFWLLKVLMMGMSPDISFPLYVMEDAGGQDIIFCSSKNIVEVVKGTFDVILDLINI